MTDASGVDARALHPPSPEAPGVSPGKRGEAGAPRSLGEGGLASVGVAEHSGVADALGELHHREDPRLVEARAKAAEHLAGWQRARADYENLRKRLEEERGGAAAAATDELLSSFLPIADYFDAAIAHVPESRRDDAWVQGILHIGKALHELLQRAGVEPIEDVDTPLDATRHEAVAEEPHPTPAGTILAVVTRGYLRNGRVLRPAKVHVSTGPATTNAPAPRAPARRAARS